MNDMNVVRIYEYGGPNVLQIGTMPPPTACEGEVLVRVAAAGVNPVDAKTRAGLGVAKQMNGFPFTVGWDVSGVVEALGVGVTRFKIGDEVYGMPRFPAQAAAYAEYITAPATELALKPRSATHVQAAALPLAALTAEQALETADLQRGQRILIHAAAGGVGHLAVQLAKARGAYVIGTASAGNLEYLRRIGVDQAIDYHAQPFEQVVSDVDVALNTVNPDILERSWSVVKVGGWVVSIVGMQSAALGEARGVRSAAILVHPDTAQLERIASLVDAGCVQVEVAHALPLREAARAHELIETGRTRGKIVLEMGL